MAIKPLPPEIVALIKHYQDAQISLINTIALTEARGNVTRYRKAILSSVNAELATLNKYAAGWAQEVIPAAYKTGAANTYAAFRAANIDVGKVAINQKVVNSLVTDTAGQLMDASRHVARMIDDEIRKAGVAATAEKLSLGDTVKQAKVNLISKLTDNGITAIRYRNGRMVKLDEYASLVARTTTREATNKASMDAVQDLGHDLVQITSTFSTCPLCASYEGRVYSISGEDKRYPILDEAFSGGYSTIHPNCFIDAQVPIFTSKGWVGIGDIKVGDSVLSHKGKFRKVIGLHRNTGTPVIIKIFTKDNQLTVTTNHPIMTNGKWMKAGSVKPGDIVRVLVNNDEHVFMDAVITDVVVNESNRTYTLYNLSVDVDESYIAKGFVVHNCTHSAVPYFEEFDDNAEQLRAESNRPFEVTPKQKASIDAYNKDQAVKAARRVDQNEWEEAKLVMPNDTPKTFSGFRAMKRADGENYRMLQHDVIYVKKTIEKG